MLFSAAGPALSDLWNGRLFTNPSEIERDFYHIELFNKNFAVETYKLRNVVDSTK